MKFNHYLLSMFSVLVTLFAGISCSSDDEEVGNVDSNLKVTITDIKTTPHSISYVVTCTHAEEAAWDYYEITPDFKDNVEAYDVLKKGKSIESLTAPYTVVIEDLKDDTEYNIYAAVESATGDRVMCTERVKTTPSDAPEVSPEETFTNGVMEVYRGKNYNIKTENEKYAMTLDFYSTDEFAYMLSIPEHEYTYDKSAYLADWNITQFTQIMDKAANTPLEIEKGSLKVTRPSNSTYEIIGKLITKDNKEFNFKFNDELPWTVDTESTLRKAELKNVNGKQVLVIDLESSLFEMPLPSELSDNKTYKFTEPVTYTVQKLNKKISIPQGELTVKSDDGVYYAMTFQGQTQEGLKLNFNISSIKVEQGEGPAPIEDEDIAFAQVKATVVEEGWNVVYQVEMTNNDWEFVFEIGTNATPGEVPYGKYVYSVINEGVSSGSLGANYSIVNKKEGMNSVTDLDEGYVEIKKNDDGSQSVVVNIKRMNGHTFKGNFKGTIDCIYYGGGEGGWE